MGWMGDFTRRIVYRNGEMAPSGQVFLCAPLRWEIAYEDHAEPR